MSTLRLFADLIEQGHQRCVGRYGLPLAHDALRVNDFAGQHGATVHRELQNMHHLFAAIHFHVRACGHKISAALCFLGRFVIEQTPERPDVARFFNGACIDVNRARIVGDYFLPFGMRCIGGKKQNHTGHQGGNSFQNAPKSVSGRWVFQFLGLGIHAPYYKVVD